MRVCPFGCSRLRPILLGHYAPYLVALSVVVPCFGGCVALDLASHARGAGRGRNGWLAILRRLAGLLGHGMTLR